MATGNYGTTNIKYDKTDLGPIYLKDCGQRNQLGGGRGLYVLGQDCYVDYGADATFLSTSEIMLSATKGVIHANDGTAFTVTITSD